MPSDQISRVCWAALAALFAAACGSEAEPPPPAATSPETRGALETPDADPIRIVMLGDSLTAGFGLPADEALPARLEAALGARGLAVAIVNAGVSGDTTGGGRDRYDFSVAAAEPDWLILALGANDYLGGKSADAAYDNLAAIIERARADGVSVMLAGVAAGGGVPGRDEDFGAIYPRLAEAYDLPLYPALLDGVRGEPGLLMEDGLHPTAAGVDVIAERMASAVAEAIAE
ncbi:MAG: arylesterase [Pseudomonadota bacterium]